MTTRLIDRIRSDNPNLATKADAHSRAAAIRLFCLECMNGVRCEVRRCTAQKCPLWPYRLGHGFDDGTLADTTPDDDTAGDNDATPDDSEEE